MNDFVIKKSPNKGSGLFSLKPFEKNQILLRFDGTKILKSSIKDFSGEKASCLLQIGKDLYLDLENHPSYFINHSCNPNCFIKIAANTAFLMSLRPIQKNEELSYDYSITSTEDVDTWQMKCFCSKFDCRKNITGFNSLSDEKKFEYLKLKIIPNYVL